jgi:enoyl-CoA hydratase
MSVLLTEDHGGVRVLTMNRPGSRNALSGELITALYQGLLAADANDDIRAVVLTGADPAFCAGVDLKQAAAEGEGYFARFRDGDCVRQVAEVRKPIIGAINGAAFTGGLEIALGCDFLVASERAVFADTHVRVGVLPGGGLTARLPTLVGAGWARRMSMTGQVVDAAAAARIGLVTEVVGHEALLARALELAATIAEIPGQTMTALKGIYRAGADSQIGRALELERELAARQAPEYDALDSRRQQVTARNRAQITEIRSH